MRFRFRETNRKEQQTEMGLYTYDSTPLPKSDRIAKLVEDLYAKMPEIEAARAVLLTQSYKETENEPVIIRRAKAFAHILEHIPIVIRDRELIGKYNDRSPRMSDVSGIFL